MRVSLVSACIIFHRRWFFRVETASCGKPASMTLVIRYRVNSCAFLLLVYSTLLLYQHTATLATHCTSFS
ncbi:hypothetical protein P692DRAFT_20159782 [Suillus brevipes Sb2]|nr:hypothetical protein P692DRAFT_20159782 [Suillus brevipes Sb2]